MLQVDGYNISLDCREKGSDIDFISHAHSDHISSAKSSKNILASKETVELLSCIRGIDCKTNAHSVKGIRMLDAGHILGSKQIVVNNGHTGEKVVYTGDFQLQKSSACNQIEIEDADTVIVDSTYCDPNVEFEERGETELALQRWTEAKLMNGIVLYGVYALGKAQEIVSLLNDVDIVPVVSKKISQINKVYTSNGVGLEYASSADDQQLYRDLTRGNFAAVVELGYMNQIAAQLAYLYKKKVYTAVATGFAAVADFGTDAQFQLSDHADFKQCKSYIEQTNARSVFTYGSNAALLAENLKKTGIDATPFKKGELLLAQEVMECIVRD